jgi:hypothetical protein
MKNLTPALEATSMIESVRWMSEPVKAQIIVLVLLRWISSSDVENRSKCESNLNVHFHNYGCGWVRGCECERHHGRDCVNCHSCQQC